jgi:hypothetical protein
VTRDDYEPDAAKRRRPPLWLLRLLALLLWAAVISLFLSGYWNLATVLLAGAAIFVTLESLSDEGPASR